MRKYLLLFAVISFVYSFFLLTAKQQISFAATPIAIGKGCFTAQGCGTTTEVCVPNGTCTGTGATAQCGTTGTCKANNATSGSCVQNASVCDKSKGYTCQQVTCTTSITGLQCTYACKKQTQQNQQCTHPGEQDTCANGTICLSAGNGTNTCQTQGKAKAPCTSATPGGQGTCANGLVCLSAGNGTNTCQAQGQLNDACTNPGGQGTCASGLVCVLQSGTVGKCENPQSPQNPTALPPPPSPPCKQWSGQGVCQTFGSTFGGFSTDPQGFIQKIFAVLLSVSGGIALLLIMKAGYQLMTAQGNPEKLNNGREQLVAAIVGLVFLIFSFVFLELIGFDILHIPGFGSNNTTVVTGGAGAPKTQ